MTPETAMICSAKVPPRRVTDRGRGHHETSVMTMGSVPLGAEEIDAALRVRSVLGTQIGVQDRGYRTPCWIWLRSLDKAGYGYASFAGEHIYLHRWTFRELHGSLPLRPWQIDHLCSQRACCNPEHLEAVLPTENVRRSRRAKLSLDDVDEILKSSESHRELARRFGVTRQTIAYYRSGKYGQRRQHWLKVINSEQAEAEEVISSTLRRPSRSRADSAGQRFCSVEDCDRKHFGLGLCQMHYARDRRARGQAR